MGGQLPPRQVEHQRVPELGAQARAGASGLRSAGKPSHHATVHAVHLAGHLLDPGLGRQRAPEHRMFGVHLVERQSCKARES